MRLQNHPGAHLLRIGVAMLLFIHGAARVGLGIVPPFGEFLSARGIPAGLALAWTLTVAELVLTPLLAARRFVTPVVVFFMIELASGIALVHWPAGWFVVGAGRNGMEFSVLLLLCLAALILFERAAPPSAGTIGGDDARAALADGKTEEAAPSSAAEY
jgi:putative oxidoreductase